MQLSAICQYIYKIFMVSYYRNLNSCLWSDVTDEYELIFILIGSDWIGDLSNYEIFFSSENTGMP